MIDALPQRDIQDHHDRMAVSINDFQGKIKPSLAEICGVVAGPLTVSPWLGQGPATTSGLTLGPPFDKLGRAAHDAVS